MASFAAERQFAIVGTVIGKADQSAIFGAKLAGLNVGMIVLGWIAMSEPAIPLMVPVISRCNAGLKSMAAEFYQYSVFDIANKYYTKAIVRKKCSAISAC